MTGFFIIGDIHGCLNTFHEMLTHWDPEQETLVQVGDLIDRGSKSPETLDLAMKLSIQFPNRAIFLKGNHEQMMSNYYQGLDNNWLINGGIETMRQINERGFDLQLLLDWINQLPLHYITDHLAVSHAGFAEHPKATEPNHPHGLLWNRSRLKNLGKPQVIGHTPQIKGLPTYDPQSNAWYIDTAAYKGICLTGMKFEHDGRYKERISIPTYSQDLIN